MGVGRGREASERAGELMAFGSAQRSSLQRESKCECGWARRYEVLGLWEAGGVA